MAAILAVASILSLACSRSDRVVTGFHLDLASAPENRGDGRPIVAIVLGNGRVRLNDDEAFAIRELPARLQEIFQYRAERVVFVQALPGISLGEFVEVVDAIYPQAGVTSTLTSEVKALTDERFCLEVSCGRCVNFSSLKTTTPAAQTP